MNIHNDYVQNVDRILPYVHFFGQIEHNGFVFLQSD